MDLCAEINAQLAKGLSGAKVNVQLMYVFIHHGRINTGNDTFTGLCDMGMWDLIRTWLVSKVESILSRQASLCRPSVGPASLSIRAFNTPPSR